MQLSDHTVSVTLYIKTQTGTDAFNAPVYSLTSEEVSGVLVGQPTSEEITDTANLYGKSIVYMLAIPKSDTHDWVDTVVELPAPFEGKYRTIGLPTAGIPDLVPLMWNKKVRLERYEQSDS